MQDYVTALPFGLLLAAHASALAALGALLVTPAPVFRGWRVVGPGGTHWFCFVGSWVFGAVISWVWLFVGSARSDAEFQMRVAFWLSVIFTAAGAGTGFYAVWLRRTALRWRGSVIRWRQSGRDVEQKFADFDAIHRGLDGRLHIRFADQTILKLDWHARNAEDLLVRFSETLGRDVY